MFILSCAPQAPEVEEIPALAVEEAQASPENAVDTVPVVETPQVVEETKPAEPELTLIYPTLKYEGAYNGPLYGTSEQVGGNFPMDKYFSNLDRNGVNWFIGFFTFMEQPKEGQLVNSAGLGRVIYGVKKHPKRITPYYNPGIGGEEVETLVGDKLTSIYQKVVPAIQDVAGSNFLRGLGEIETQEWKISHNDPKVIQLFDLAKLNNINFMFHPVASKIEQVEQIAKAYPAQKIIIHMYREDLDKSRDKLIKMLNDNANLYFSIDAAHIAHSNNMDILYDYDASIPFISKFDQNYKNMLNDAVSDYRPLVEGAPDKVMWGTEAGPKYSFEPEVYDRLIKISREFIGQMKPEYQEGLAYKNALKAFGQGVTLEKDIVLIDASSWKDCTSAQINSCDDECETPEGEVEDPVIESCYQGCLVRLQCKDVVEED